MEVIKKGREQKGWSKKYKCTGAGNGGGGCKAMLLVSHGDLYRTCRSDYLGDTYDHCITSRCPCCKVQTDIKRYNGPEVTRRK